MASTRTLGANDGAYNEKHFFQLDPELRRWSRTCRMLKSMRLKRGGHDFRKLYAAFAEARAESERPTVILAKTKKGYGMGQPANPA